MKDIKRKHLWPVALVAALAVVGMLAAFVVLAGPQRGMAEAQSLCAGASGATLAALIQAGTCSAATTTPAPTTGGGGAPGPVAPGATQPPGATTPAGGGDGSVCATATGDELAALIQAGVCMAPTATPVPPTPAPTSTPTGSAPVAVNEINDVSLLERSSNTMPVSASIYTAAIDVSDNFRDDGTLTYTARSSNAARATVAVAGSRVTVTGVAPGLATITVTATDASSRTATQRFRVTVLDDVLPSAPRNARAYPLDNAITLRWSTPIFDGVREGATTTITGYRITRTVSSDSPLKGDGGDKVINVDASTQVYRDQGLSYNEFYTYRVQALNNSGDNAAGASSAPLTLRTAESGGRIEPETRAPSPPRDVTLLPACDDMITVSWTAPADPGLVRKPGPGGYVGPDFEGGRGAGIEIQGTAAEIEYYRVERRVGAGDTGDWVVIAPEVRTLSYVDRANLAYGSTYTYRVTARNNVPLYSDPAVAQSETLTRPETPAPPTSLVAVDVSATHQGQPSFELQWDAPIGDWRNAADIDDNNESRRLSYRIERKLAANESWEGATILARAQKHQYSTDGLTTRLTQDYTDENPPVGQGINYRVAAQYDQCVQSHWNQADEVRISIFSQRLGVPMDLTATVGAPGGTGTPSAPGGTGTPSTPGGAGTPSTPGGAGTPGGTGGTDTPGGAGATGGTVTLRWTPGANSQMHWVAGIKQSDWDAGDYSNVIWTRADSNTMHTVTGLDSGAEYAFTVAAGRQATGEDAEWSAWAVPLARATPD